MQQLIVIKGAHEYWWNRVRISKKVRCTLKSRNASYVPGIGRGIQRIDLRSVAKHGDNIVPRIFAALQQGRYYTEVWKRIWLRQLKGLRREKSQIFYKEW